MTRRRFFGLMIAAIFAFPAALLSQEEFPSDLESRGTQSFAFCGSHHLCCETTGVCTLGCRREGCPPGKCCVKAECCLPFGCGPSCPAAAVPVCGNGEAEEGEVCGEPALGSCPEGLICEECRCRGQGECGDGKIDLMEECDDGNSEEGDGCSLDCLIEWSAWTPAQREWLRKQERD